MAGCDAVDEVVVVDETTGCCCCTELVDDDVVAVFADEPVVLLERNTEPTEPTEVLTIAGSWIKLDGS